MSRSLRSSVGAHYGAMGWLAQRLTAVLMVAYTLVFLAILMWHGGLDYASWNALLDNGPFRLSTFLFMVALLYHAWIGMRDIYMDYLKPVGVRLAAEVITVVLLVAYLGWTIALLWGARA